MGVYFVCNLVWEIYFDTQPGHCYMVRICPGSAASSGVAEPLRQSTWPAACASRCSLPLPGASTSPGGLTSSSAASTTGASAMPYGRMHCLPGGPRPQIRRLCSAFRPLQRGGRVPTSQPPARQGGKMAQRHSLVTFGAPGYRSRDLFWSRFFLHF